VRLHSYLTTGRTATHDSYMFLAGWRTSLEASCRIQKGKLKTGKEQYLIAKGTEPKQDIWGSNNFRPDCIGKGTRKKEAAD